MAKKLLATIEASNGGVISLSLDEDGRLWNTVAQTGAQFVSGTPHAFKTEQEAIQAIREAWGSPAWKLQFAEDVSNQK